MYFPPVIYSPFSTLNLIRFILVRQSLNAPGLYSKTRRARARAPSALAESSSCQWALNLRGPAQVSNTPLTMHTPFEVKSQWNERVNGPFVTVIPARDLRRGTSTQHTRLHVCAGHRHLKRFYVFDSVLEIKHGMKSATEARRRLERQEAVTGLWICFEKCCGNKGANHLTVLVHLWKLSSYTVKRCSCFYFIV